MANLHQMLQAAGGSFQAAETMALKAATSQPEFWLDLALLMSVQGKFSGARQAQTKYMEHFPNCPRVKFAMAPFAISDGELQVGLGLMEYGREISCWGRKTFPAMKATLWDGRSIEGKTLLVLGEGGLGDEIIGLRAASWARERGSKCLMACSKALMSVFDTPAVACAVDMEYVSSVHCDYWLPSMSAPRLFGRTWETLWPGQYLSSRNERLNRTWRQMIPKVRGKINVGIRWRGNPQFEHENLRRFDPELLFKATDVSEVTRWSLQKDADAPLPDDVNDLEPFLSSWEHTAAAMSQLDLVITSCTSIAHLAGAMSIPCWTIVPVMPYYYAARPGPATDWYPSMRIFRQECYGDWSDPFRQVKRELEALTKGA